MLLTCFYSVDWHVNIEWANGATNDMDWNKLRRKNYLEMAMNYATGGKSSLVVPDSGSEVGDDQTVSDLDDSSVSGSPVSFSCMYHMQMTSSKYMYDVVSFSSFD